MRAKGLSLVEILIAMGIVSLMAVLMVPKVINATTKIQAGSVGKTEQIMALLSKTLDMYTTDTGLELTLTGSSTDNLSDILYEYGNYFIYKSYLDSGGAPISYYLLQDGSRLSGTAKLFTATTIISDYNPGTGVLANNWNGTSNYCGNFDDKQCLYYDYNGKTLPNTIGKKGDIIPIRVEPETGKIRTLYEWMRVTNPTMSAATLCRYVSAYDVEAGAPGAASCP